MENAKTQYDLIVTIKNDINSDPVVTVDTYGNESVTYEGEGEKYILDTYQYEPIFFDMSINEIQDITQRNSTHSMSIKLPDTDHNRMVFGYISGLNVDTQFYNPNKKADCVILVDSLPIYSGTLQLKKVDYNFKTGEVNLEVVFFSNVLDIYKKMGELYLTDLSGLSRLNHYYTTQEVTKSWTQSQSYGYYYPLIDYGRKINQTTSLEESFGLNIDQLGGSDPLTSIIKSSASLDMFYPAVYVKTIVDEIFLESGYQYDSNFFNSNFFSNLIVPFTNKSLTYPTVLNDNFYGYASNNFVIDKNQANLFNTGSGYNLVVETYNIYHTIGSSQSVSVSYVMGVTQCYYKSQAGQVNNYGFFAGSQTYSEVNYPYKNNKSINIGISPSVKVNFTGTQSGYNTFKTLLNIPDGFGFNPTIFFSFCSKKIGKPVNIIKCATGYDLYPEYFDANNNTSPNIFNMEIDSPIYKWPNSNSGNFFNGTYYSMEPGEECFVMLNVMYFRSTGSGAPSLFYEFISSQSKTFITWTDNIVSPGELVDIPSNLPQNVKQKDFLTNLYKMFNLYVEQDKEFSNLLRIEPRDDYYQNNGDTVIINWTSKIDLDQPISLDILSSDQSKTFRYTYKEDKDYFNLYYKTFTNRVQGDAIKEIDNDFSTGEKKIELIFGSSVLCNIPGYTNFPVPNFTKQIGPQNFPIGSTDLNIKILQKNGYGGLSYSHFGCVDVFNNEHFKLGTYSSYTQSATYSFYPYAGTYDDPYNPSIDINFDQQLVHFWYQPNTVNDNLFNTYQQNQFNEIADIKGRILTCEMYLTPQDIHNFYFNHIVYLELGGQGAYWRVNSIKNYDITCRSTCTVELIKALYPQVKL